MRVKIVTIGDELLIGQVVDTNSAWMGRELNLIGAKVESKVAIGDDHGAIIEAIEEGLRTSDVVLLTGGLGPTKDDITKKAIADFFNVELSFHEPTWEKIQKLFRRWGRSTTPAHKEQCFHPEHAILLENKMGTAPGMWFDHEGKVVVSMPGVPYEMQYIMKHGVLPKLQEQFPGKAIIHHTVLTAGEGESRIALRLQELEAELPSFIKLSYLPNLGQVRLRLSGEGEDHNRLAVIMEEKLDLLKSKVADLIFGYGEDRLEAAVGRFLKEKKLMVGTAESCTGGYIAHLLTSVPGSSAYFEGAVIAYSNKIKQQVLGVKKETLDNFGAVSEQTVIEMVKGTIASLGVDIAIAVSGIAGPTGGTPEKPVGTVWLAVGNSEKVDTVKLQLGKDRIKNIQYSAVKALNELRLFLIREVN